MSQYNFMESVVYGNQYVANARDCSDCQLHKCELGMADNEDREFACGDELVIEASVNIDILPMEEEEEEEEEMEEDDKMSMEEWIEKRRLEYIQDSEEDEADNRYYNPSAYFCMSRR